MNQFKQAVIRKTLSGEWEPFTFDLAGAYFFVKNMTNGAIYVSFEDDDYEEESFKLAKGESEKLAICFDPNEWNAVKVRTIYVKGTGEVEVRSLDAFNSVVSQHIEVIEDTLELGRRDDIVGTEIVIGSDNTRIRNHALEIS